ncbi:MAG: DTW domain-containing protein, partial [Candidatus Binatia bacterium]
MATCFCALIEPFESWPRFVILCHPREARHRLGTGRMAHLAMVNSTLIEGIDFSRHARVNEILSDDKSFCAVLYPKTTALSLSELSQDQRALFVSPGKNPVIFVLDGT